MNDKIKKLAGIFKESLPQPKKPDNNPPQRLGGELWYQ